MVKSIKEIKVHVSGQEKWNILHKVNFITRPASGRWMRRLENIRIQLCYGYPFAVPVLFWRGFWKKKGTVCRISFVKMRGKFWYVIKFWDGADYSRE